MIDFDEFERLVRDALSNLYDYSVLETHPLNAYFPKPQNEDRGHYLNRLLQETIDTLRPSGKEGSLATDEQRPYLVLHGRYVEGLSLTELQNRLALGERQLRRLQSRSIHALASMLWDQVFQKADTDQPEGNNPFSYAPRQEPVHIPDAIQGVLDIFQKRAHEIQFVNQIAPNLPLIQTDRVILRQILISMINLAINISDGSAIHIDAQLEQGWLNISVSVKADDESAYQLIKKQGLLESSRYWVQQLNARLQLLQPGEDHDRVVALALYAPHEWQPGVYVVEDPESSIRLYDRYLRRRHFQVIGIQDARRVMEMAPKDQPQAIILDIMMPALDGWEVLQMIKAHPHTRHIPVVVCSAWGDANLALSLGASAFLRKPISAQQLLDAFQELKLLDSLEKPPLERQ
jgi:CheY-like chemotaxis protein